MENDKWNILAEHLPYEHTMLEHAYFFLVSESFAELRKDWFLRNAAINVFWMHARNLIEFYRNRPNVSASASDYTKSELRPELRLKKGGPAEDKLGVELTTLINEQIVHLKNERVKSPDEKLGGYEPMFVFDAIERVRKDFERDLTDQVKTIWTYAPRDSIQISGVASATNHIEIVSSENRGPTVYEGPKN